MRLLEGANIYQVAKDCRTSGEIEKFYASHIKTGLTTAAINQFRSALIPAPGAIWSQHGCE